MNDESNTVILAEVISNTVAAYIEQTKSKTSFLEVKLETKSNTKTPKIEINKGRSKSALQTLVILPGNNENSITFNVSVTLNSNKTSVDAKQLKNDISKEIKKQVKFKRRRGRKGRKVKRRRPNKQTNKTNQSK